MGAFIVGIILLVLGLVLLAVGKITLPGVARRGVVAPDRRIGLRLPALIAVALGALVFVGSMVKVVGATSVGIPVTFGKIGSPLRPGFHLVAPWTEITTFSTRLQQSDMTQVANEGDRTVSDGVEVLSSEGGKMVLDVTVRYFIDSSKAGDLFRQVGTMDGIRERIVRPDVRSLLRDVYSRYTAEEAYSSKRESAATAVEDETKTRLSPRGITIDGVKVRNITLEPNLQQQITAKLEAKQAAERALIEQQKAQTEAETRRKVAETDALAAVIAAKGQADANNALAASLTPDLLRAKEIEAIARNGNTVLYPYGQPVTPIVDNRGPVASGVSAPVPAAAVATTAAPATTAATTPPTTAKG